MQKWSQRLSTSKRGTRSSLRSLVLQMCKFDVIDWSHKSLFFLLKFCLPFFLHGQISPLFLVSTATSH